MIGIDAPLGSSGWTQFPAGGAATRSPRRFAEEVIPRFDVSSGEFVSRNFYDAHDLK
jgi:hypothetical protein